MYLEQLAQCPEAEDRQGTADLAALETPKGVKSLSAPLCFQAEKTEKSTRWRPPRPETLAGLAHRSPEGSEEIWAPCDAVYTALPWRGPALKSPGPGPLAHCVPDGSRTYCIRQNYNQPLFLFPRELTARAPLPRHAAHNDIRSQYACASNSGRQEAHQALSPRGRNRGAGF